MLAATGSSSLTTRWGAWPHPVYQAAVSEPPTYASVIRDNPIEWFDSSMSYGVFNWGLNSVGVSTVASIDRMQHVEGEADATLAARVLLGGSELAGHATHAEEGALVPPQHRGLSRSHEAAAHLRASLPSNVPRPVFRGEARGERHGLACSLGHLQHREVVSTSRG